MVDKIEKFNCKVFSQTLKKDCLEKLVMPEFFSIIGEEDKKEVYYKPFSKMSINEVSTALESFDDICNYNKDFAQLRLEYLSKTDKFANILRFREYVFYSHSGYYYKKALFFFVLKVLLIIAGLYITFSLDYPKSVCIKVPFDTKKDKTYWIYNDKKYKVNIIERDREWYLRLVYFIFFDLIYLLIEFCFLLTLQRAKFYKSMIIFYQILKYLCNVAIIVLIFRRENYCENSDNDKNIFYIKTNILEKILIIEDLIKLIIIN